MIKKLSYTQRFKKKKNGAREVRKVNKKIQIIAGRLLRDIARKLPMETLGKYLPDLKLYQAVLSQKRGTVIKFTACMNLLLNVTAKAKSIKNLSLAAKLLLL